MAQTLASPSELYAYGKGDTVIVVGDLSTDDAVRWATALGLFLTRGGSARWVPNRRP